MTTLRRSRPAAASCVLALAAFVLLLADPPAVEGARSIKLSGGSNTPSKLEEAPLTGRITAIDEFELQELETELILFEDKYVEASKLPSNGGRLETFFTPGAVLVPFEINLPIKGTRNLQLFFETQKTGFQARFADFPGSVVKCYSPTLCTRHGQMTYSAGTSTDTPPLTDARQLVVYTRQALAVGTPDADAPSSGSSDSDSDSDSSDSDAKGKGKAQGSKRGLLQSDGTVSYGNWLIAEMHMSVGNSFNPPLPPK